MVYALIIALGVTPAPPGFRTPHAEWGAESPAAPVAPDLASGVLITPPEETRSAEISPEVDAILTRVESKGNQFTDLRCNLEYRIDDRINLDELVRYGAIAFKRAEPHDVFMIHFHTLVQDDRETKQRKWYLFKDRWLWDATERSKTITKREVVAKGERIDLFDLESAPFPVPFGQKKANILRNFDVTLVPALEGDPPGSDHVVCVPKPGSQVAREFSRLDFYVSKAMGLPVKIVTTETGNDKVIKVTTAVFGSIQTDGGLTDKDFAEPADWKTYVVIEEPLPQPQPAPANQ